MSKTYTNEEILERLKSLEGLLLERVFETSYSESLRTYDLIDHLRSKAHDLGLEGEDRRGKWKESVVEPAPHCVVQSTELCALLPLDGPS